MLNKLDVTMLADTSRYVASGSQTYSKQPKRYVMGVYPNYIESGSGAFVSDIYGNSYIDYPCALGAIILGYSNQYVNDRVSERLKKGTLFSLPHRSETQLAIAINKMIPSMQSMRFLKSGSEAVSAAVKIARSFTKRDVVLSCGYHGWHDWSTPITVNNSGTPKSFGNTIYEFQYNDLEAVKKLFITHKKKVACVVIDPYIFDEPKDGFLNELEKLCHQNDSLLIFDEVVTGIRWDRYSVQNCYGIKPDITAIGKTLANGIPISCVGGTREIMDELDKKCFVSSTYGGDLIGIEGALATLSIAQSENLPDKLKDSGDELKGFYNLLAEDMKLDTRCVGAPYRMNLRFPSDNHKALFWQECLKRGVLFGGAQHTSLAHTSPIINRTIQVIKESMEVLKKHWSDPTKALEGSAPESVSTVANSRKSYVKQ